MGITMIHFSSDQYLRFLNRVMCTHRGFLRFENFTRTDYYYLRRRGLLIVSRSAVSSAPRTRFARGRRRRRVSVEFVRERKSNL